MGYYYRITDKKGNVIVRDITGSELLGGTTNLSTVVRAVADRWSEDEEYSFFQSVTAEGMEMVEKRLWNRKGTFPIVLAKKGRQNLHFL